MITIPHCKLCDKVASYIFHNVTVFVFGIYRIFIVPICKCINQLFTILWLFRCILDPLYSTGIIIAKLFGGYIHLYTYISNVSWYTNIIYLFALFPHIKWRFLVGLVLPFSINKAFLFEGGKEIGNSMVILLLVAYSSHQDTVRCNSGIICMIWGCP